MHEALQSAADKPAYDPRIGSEVPKYAMFHSNGSSPQRGSQAIPCRKVQGAPVEKVSDLHWNDIPLLFLLLRKACVHFCHKSLSQRKTWLFYVSFQDELMRVPLAGIQAILSRNRLRAASEESIYDFVLRWARSRYPNSEVRDKILSSRLLPLVPWVLGMTDDIQIDHPSCIINFTIKREKCCGLVPSGLMRSPSFHCAGRDFFLSACCVTTEQSQFFSLAIKMLEDKGAVRGTIDYEIGAKTRPSLKFVTKYRCTTSTDSMGQDGCCVPWSELMADDNPYFIDDKLHLQIHVKITPLP